MGGFCVFGVSKQVLRKKIEKNTATFYFEGKNRIERTVTEWGDLVLSEVERQFAEEERQVKVSPEFDSPHFCKDWIAAGPNEVRLTKIMCRSDKIDKHGSITIRKGVPVQAWVEYDESKQNPRPFGEP